MNTKNLLRWLSIVIFGGYGIYTLGDFFLHISSMTSDYWFMLWFFLVPFMLIYSGLFIAIAYFLFRQQYQHVGKIISVLAAIIVCGLLFLIPQRLGMQKYLFDWSKDSPWLVFIVLPISLTAVFIPFYAARWTYRSLQTFLSKYIHENTKFKRVT